jgi:hypothetical protein
VGLEAGDEADPEVRLAGGDANDAGHGAGGDAGQVAEQGASRQAVGPESFGQGEDDLPVRHRGEQGLVQPEAPPGEALGVTTRAEVTRLTGERVEVLVGAGIAADPGEAVLQDATGEELVDHLGNHAAPVAVGRGEALIPHQAELPEVAISEPVERGGPQLSP